MWNTVITASTTGIGKATALKFLDAGYSVHGLDTAVGVPDELAKYPNYTHHNVLSEGRPDIKGVRYLINASLLMNSGNDISWNLEGTQRTIEKYGLQPDIKGIVTVTDAIAMNGASFPDYCASIGGLIIYNRYVAKEVAKYGAVCNTISFGGVVTSLNDVVLNDPDLWRQAMDVTPLKRWTTPAECGDWIFFLAVVNSSCTAQNIVVDNGESFNHKFVWRE